MNDFLPDDYEEPIITGNYMKFEEGDNAFRVLSSAIVGWEIWGDKVVDGKTQRVPYRFHQHEKVPTEYTELENENNRFKFFWAFVVWNRAAKKIQILEITQSGIRKAIGALSRNEKWGNPKEYDIVVTRTKTGSEAMNVEYSVTPEPREQLEQEIARAYVEKGIKLDALYKGDDPFSKEEKVDPDEVDV